MRIRFKNVSYIRVKVAFCIGMFVLGLYIFISVLLLLIGFGDFEYQTINGSYISYREDSTANYSGFNRHIYITVGFSNNNKMEYEINPVSLSSFKSAIFLDEVSEGDSVELIVEKNYYILSINSNGKSYLKIEDTLNNDRQNMILGCFIGGVCVCLSVICFLTLIKMRYKKH